MSKSHSVLYHSHAKQAYRGRSRTAPVNLNLGTRRRQVVKIVPQQIYARERIRLRSEHKAGCVPESGVEVWRRKDLFFLPVFKHRTVKALHWTLHRLRKIGSHHSTLKNQDIESIDTNPKRHNNTYLYMPSKHNFL